MVRRSWQSKKKTETQRISLLDAFAMDRVREMGASDGAMGWVNE